MALAGELLDCQTTVAPRSSSRPRQRRSTSWKISAHSSRNLQSTNRWIPVRLYCRSTWRRARPLSTSPTRPKSGHSEQIWRLRYGRLPRPCGRNELLPFQVNKWSRVQRALRRPPSCSACLSRWQRRWTIPRVRSAFLACANSLKTQRGGERWETSLGFIQDREDEPEHLDHRSFHAPHAGVRRRWQVR